MVLSAYLRRILNPNLNPPLTLKGQIMSMIGITEGIPMGQKLTDNTK